jgi:parallel beta-helix repeat protein
MILDIFTYLRREETMKKSIIRKNLVLGIIVLFISMSITTSTGNTIIKKPINPISNGKTLYVGGTGEGNYSKIQAAINDASDGDTVFVYNGIYNEGDIDINKQIKIIGQNRDKTIVYSGYDYIFGLFHKNVTISGFTLQIKSPYLKDSESEILKTFVGQRHEVIIMGAKFCNVTNNHITDSGDVGITVAGSNSIVKKNIITNHVKGIWIVSSGYANTITNNHFENNNDGVYLTAYKNNNIIANNFIKNKRHASFIDSFNCWRRNYWDDWIKILPFYIIKGYIVTHELEEAYDFDWSPARRPYDFSNGSTISYEYEYSGLQSVNKLSIRFLERFPLLKQLLKNLYTYNYM